jgi:hypothetical protein
MLGRNVKSNDFDKAALDSCSKLNFVIPVKPAFHVSTNK